MGRSSYHHTLYANEIESGVDAGTVVDIIIPGDG